MLKSTAERLFSALLGYVTLIVILMTLNPFYVAWPTQFAFRFESNIENLIQNVMLFLPIGYLYRLITGRRGALLLGAMLSLGIETIQLFIPARTASVIDIMANAAGAGLGALACSLISERIPVSSGTMNRLRLETPLMGLVYLLIPLLWIDVLALNEAPGRWFLTVLIGILGAVIFSDLFRHWWETVDLRVISYAVLAAGIWFFIGSGPRLLGTPRMWIIGFAIMLLTAVMTTITKRNQERRFEQRTLQRFLPIFTLYLLLLTLCFPFSSFSTWHGFFGFTDRITERSLYALYPRLEYLAAFTVLGYVIAEWRGRLELSLARDFPGVLLLATSAGLLLEVLSGFQSGRGASVIRLVLAVGGAAFGGTLYHLSRAHIRFLLGR